MICLLFNFQNDLSIQDIDFDSPSQHELLPSDNSFPGGSNQDAKSTSMSSYQQDCHINEVSQTY